MHAFLSLSVLLFLLSFTLDAKGASWSGDKDCPKQLQPVDLPHPLPQPLVDGLNLLEDTLKKSLNSTSIPSISASLVYKGRKIWEFHDGTVNKTMGKVKPTGESIYRIGSISKVLTSLLLYLAKQTGVIPSIESKVTDWIPEWTMKHYFDDEPDITLRQLACHLSGLPRASPCQEIGGCNLTLDQIIPLAKNDYYLFPSDTRPSYSNMGFALLGRILSERVYKVNDFEMLVKKLITDPLNMTVTGCTMSKDQMEKLAVGYNEDGSVATLWNLGFEIPAGEYYSTSDEMSLLMTELLSGGEGSGPAPKLFKKRILRDLFRPSFINPGGLSGFGNPWEMYLDKDHWAMTKGGNIDGYAAMMSLWPQWQLGLVTLWSGSFEQLEVSTKLRRILVKAMKETLGPLQEATVLAPPNPQIYVGQYIGSQSNVRIDIATNSDGVLTSGGLLYRWSGKEHYFLAPHGNTENSCLLYEFEANQNTAIIFTIDPASGKASSFFSPGVAYTDIFKRVE